MNRYCPSLLKIMAAAPWPGGKSPVILVQVTPPSLVRNSCCGAVPLQFTVLAAITLALTGETATASAESPALLLNCAILPQVTPLSRDTKSAGPACSAAAYTAPSGPTVRSKTQ